MVVFGRFWGDFWAVFDWFWEFLGGFWRFLGRFILELPYFGQKLTNLAQIWFWSTSNFINFSRNTIRATSVAHGPQARELFCVQTLWDILL